jgi:phage replication O-like protein O
MADVQVENGYTKIASVLIEAFAQQKLSSAEWQVLMTIIRKTYGWSKREDRIPLYQFRISTGMTKQSICKAIARLVQRKMIVKIDNKRRATYRIQKNFDQWKPLSKLIKSETLSNQTKEGNDFDNESLSILTTPSSITNTIDIFNRDQTPSLSKEDQDQTHKDSFPELGTGGIQFIEYPDGSVQPKHVKKGEAFFIPSQSEVNNLSQWKGEYI